MYKKILFITLFFTLILSYQSKAQLDPGDTAPDWTLTDIDGNTHHLYDILDQGKNVIIDFSATWCGPCWSFHHSGTLEHLYETYGPDGTDELMVFFIEGDVTTTSADLHGTGNRTLGDWVTGTPYPIIDITSQQILVDYKLPYWPTVYTICNDRKIKVQGRFSIAGFENHLNGCPDAVPRIELTNTEISNASCLSSEDGSINLTIEGPNPPFSVYWSDGSNSNGALSNIGSGTYNATIIDQSGGFLEVGPFQVGYESEGVSGGVANIQAASCSDGLGSINIEITSGTAESFLWSNGATTEDVDNLSPGTYSVVITGSGGCEQTIDEIVVEGANVPSINLIPIGQLSCLESAIEIDATNSVAEEGDEIIWTTEDGNIVLGSTTLNPSVDLLGTYTITITNQDGCSAQSSIFIQNPELPIVNIADTEELTCSISCINLDATNSSTGDNIEIDWSTTDGAFSDGISTLTPMVCQSGTYSLLVTNTENGCSQMATIEIHENEDIPDAHIDGTTELNCNVSSIELSASESNSGFSYSWLNSNGLEISTGNNTVISENGVYTLVVNDPSNGCSSSSEIEIEKNISTPTITDISASNDISCSQNSATINVNSSNTNNATYYWTSPSGEITESTTSNLEVSSAGVYLLTIENENGCNTTTEIEVIGSSDTPQAFASSGTISCQVTEISLSGSSNFENVTYDWTGPNGFTSNEQNPTVTASGEYNLTVIAANGCSSSTTTRVEGDTETPQVTSISGFSNCSEYGLQIETIGNNLTFSWMGPNGFTSNEQNPNITESIEGEFTCVVTNEYGCSTEVKTTVEDNSDIPTVTEAFGLVNCNTSTLTIQIEGNPTSYTYSWTGPNGFSSIEQNPEINYRNGVYTCVVTSSTGCQVSTEAEVTVDTEEPQIKISYSNDIDCNNTTATIEVNEIQENLNYQWSGPNNFTASAANLAVNEGGEYELIVINPKNGCESMEIISIAENTDPVFIELNNESISCDISSIPLPPSIDGQDVIWKNEQETQVSENATESGNYTGTFVNSYGCDGTVTMTIEDDITKPQFELNGTKITCTNESAILSINAQTAIRSVAWSGPGITPANKYQTNPEITIGGTYSANVTGENGCAESKDKEIEEDPKLDIEIQKITNISCFGESDGKVEFDLITGTPPLEYNFDFDKDLSKGSYFAKVTDANGCIDELSFTIIEPEQIDILFEEVKNATDSKLGSAKAIANGGTAPFTYKWGDGTTNQTNESLNIGLHSVLITDANGCTQESSITIEKSTQLNDIESLTRFKLTPNPNVGIFTVLLKFEKTTSCTIEVISLLGSKIYSETFSDKLIFNRVFDLSHLQSGSYLIKVINDAGEQVVKKISIIK